MTGKAGERTRSAIVQLGRLAWVEVSAKCAAHRCSPPRRPSRRSWDKYSPNSYPFIDFGGNYVITTPIYDPRVLQGQSRVQIAAALHHPPSPIAQGALGAANYITAAICKMIGNQPASVCTAPAISALEARL